MKCPKCGSEHIGYDDLTIACCTECHCDWNEFTALTAERDALAAELAALKKRVADAPRTMLYPRDESEKTKWVAVLDLEDGE